MHLFICFFVNTDFVGRDLKFKAFADNKLNVARKMISVYDMIENMVGKKEKNAGYQHFLLLPQCFQKAASSGLSKFCCLVKSLEQILQFQPSQTCSEML